MKQKLLILFLILVTAAISSVTTICLTPQKHLKDQYQPLYEICQAQASNFEEWEAIERRDWKAVYYACEKTAKHIQDSLYKASKWIDDNR